MRESQVTRVRAKSIGFIFQTFNLSEPEGRGAAWTDERGTSDEGRRRLKDVSEVE